MKIKAKIMGFLPQQRGTSANGDWVKTQVILQYTEQGETYNEQAQYPTNFCATFFEGKGMTEKTNALLSISVGEVVDVFYNIEAREYQSRWYTDIRLWKVERNGQNQMQQAPQPQQPLYQQVQQQPMQQMAQAPQQPLPYKQVTLPNGMVATIPQGQTQLTPQQMQAINDIQDVFAPESNLPF